MVELSKVHEYMGLPIDWRRVEHGNQMKVIAPGAGR